MLSMELPKNLKAIARAGPESTTSLLKVHRKRNCGFQYTGRKCKCRKRTCSRITVYVIPQNIQGISWVQSLKGKGNEVAELVEKYKSQFAGPEIKGKKLGLSVLAP